MTFTFSLPNTASRRLRRWSTLLLLALVLVTGVSLSMTRQQGARLAEVDELILPSVRLVHEMTVVVDEARGLSALHLLRADPAERQDLEERLQAARQRIERRMAVSRQRLADDTERRHFQQVRASLSAYWAAQDRLLAASRLAVDTPPAATQARDLLGGDSQSAFQQLRADLDAWWAYTDELAGMALSQGASQARQQSLLLGVQACLLLVLGACLLAGRQPPGAGAPTPRRARPSASLSTPAPVPAPASAPAPASNGPAEPVPMSLAQLAFQARLLALNATVAAARGGAVGQADAPAEQELRRLAAQLGATATGLSALAASPPTDADSGDPGLSGLSGLSGDPGVSGDAGDRGNPGGRS